jgi:hypothetical protein
LPGLLYSAKNDNEPSSDNGSDDNKKKKMSYDGKRCQPFDYSGKLILSLKDYREKVKNEIKRVKGLEHDRKGVWIEVYCISGEIYCNDPPHHLEKHGTQTEAKLNANGI